jgi:hypothetical protein
MVTAWFFERAKEKSRTGEDEGMNRTWSRGGLFLGKKLVVVLTDLPPSRLILRPIQIYLDNGLKEATTGNL